MLIEIKFRGKTVGDIGSFAFGYYHFDNQTNTHYIATQENLIRKEVHPETIGQYTGLKDKDGKEIYKGDWCRAQFRDKNGFQMIQGKIIMSDYMWCIDCTGSIGGYIYSINRPHLFEVLGNIYEHPELINTSIEHP